MQEKNMCIFNQVPHFFPFFLCCCSAVVISAKTYDLPTPGFSFSVCNDLNNVGLQAASTKQSLPLLTAEFLSPGEVVIFTQGKTLA